jgi:ABC-type phosphate/phosphonate transport system substrate-binding protein
MHVTDWIMNAGMYAVTPEVETGWRTLVENVARDARVALTYVPDLAAQPLDELCTREDLGAVHMCGYTIALKRAPVIPIAAPIPSAVWAAGRAVYRSDLIVRQDAPYRTLEDTFGARAGWTVTHSQSGFNAFRHHLLAYRTAQRSALYGEMVGNLATTRNVLDSVREGRIDVGPVDAYWHMLIARHTPQLTAGIRVLTSTEVTPMPPFVAAVGAPADMVRRLRAAFTGAALQPWFKPLGDLLLIEGFAEVDAASFAKLLEWDREAKAAGFAVPA